MVNPQYSHYMDLDSKLVDIENSQNSKIRKTSPYSFPNISEYFMGPWKTNGNSLCQKNIC